MSAFAVIKTGGKQYQVKSGDVLKIERLAGKNTGDVVELPALAIHNGSDLQVGKPELEQKVSAKIVGEGRDKKVLIFKKTRREVYKKTRGHRQHHHRIQIETIPGT